MSKNEKEQLNPVERAYLKGLHELELYVKYCLRCLHRFGIYPKPTDFALLEFLRDNGTLAIATVYPLSCVKDNEVINPMFFYGFKFEYDFRDLENPIEIIYCDTFTELKK